MIFFGILHPENKNSLPVFYFFFSYPFSFYHHTSQVFVWLAGSSLCVVVSLETQKRFSCSILLSHSCIVPFMVLVCVE